MFKKILIANRGEIAIRIVRACRQLGIGNVAVFSDADRGALHVRMADEAYHLGPAPASQSYLCAERLIATARRAGADAIHPGYGFLAENWKFAQLVEDSGLKFIGPPPEAIRLLGDKLEARSLAEKHGVSVVPGGATSSADLRRAAELAERCGYPVLVKAVAGGGGKGMRLVGTSSELEKSLIAAGNEARSAFGDDRVFIEKFLLRPRHIEIQIARDRLGNAVYLGERECSIQRRHQKLIEEAPSTFVDSELRRRMGKVAIEAITAAGYVNLGTVEFLVDGTRHFYFLEVNTRLQVEHPVTELVCGIDLVTEQISIAAGNELSFRQEDLGMIGHALECRICAEDAEDNFLPSTGQIISYREPAGPGVRVDSGVREGSEITPYYDSLIAKLITYGATRTEAISRMRQALSEYRIAGPATNISFHEAVMDVPAFASGELSTSFIPDHFPNGTARIRADDHAYEAAAAAAALHHYLDARRLRTSSASGSTSDRWLESGRARGVNRLGGGAW